MVTDPRSHLPTINPRRKLHLDDLGHLMRLPFFIDLVFYHEVFVGFGFDVADVDLDSVAGCLLQKQVVIIIIIQRGTITPAEP
jgi:hypothetical protein